MTLAEAESLLAAPFPDDAVEWTPCAETDTSVMLVPRLKVEAIRQRLVEVFGESVQEIHKEKVLGHTCRIVVDVEEGKRDWMKFGDDPDDALRKVARRMGMGADIMAAIGKYAPKWEAK